MKSISLAVRKYIFAIILPACVPLLFAQNSDWGVWTTVDAEKQLSKNWELGTGVEYRWQDNVSNQIRGKLGASRKMGEYVKLGAGYALIADKKAGRDDFEYRNRFFLQASGSYRYARFTASLRTRMQLTLQETDGPRGNLFKDDDSFNWVWRNRFELKYGIKGVPLEPYANIELFYHPFGDSETVRYYQNRLSVGLVYTFANRHTLETGYKLENEIGGSRKYHIIELGYAYSF